MTVQKRNTIQRQLVISAVRSLSNHPTAEEVYNRIVLDYPDISKGTVYRNLNSLDRYDHMLTKHYHVQCMKCHRFMNVDDLDYFQDLDDKIAQMTGYRMENHNIVFQGICPECQIEELEAKKREVEMAKAEGRKPDKISAKL